MTDVRARLKWDTESGSESFLLEPGCVVTLGRDPSNDVVIPIGSISRHHARIEWIGDDCVLHDLGSANGTYVNGQKVGRAPWILSNGDRIQIHIFRLRFEIGEHLSEQNAEQIVEGEKDEKNGGFDKQGRRLPQTMELHSREEEERGATFVSQKFAGPDYLPVPKYPRLVARSGVDAGRTFDLAEPAITIGYASLEATWDIKLNDPSVGQPHARLEKRGDTYWLADLGSERGTQLNGMLINAPTFLKEGDVITLGDARLIYRKAD